VKVLYWTCANAGEWTEQERANFGECLKLGFVDAFRNLHGMGPDGKHWPGHYTYWSVRAGNRQYNAGLRLDYFVVSKCLFDKGGFAMNPRTSCILHILVHTCMHSHHDRDYAQNI
jgi:exonuclease III